MACEDRKEALVALLYDELDGDAQRETREHLERCEGCSADFEQMTRARDRLAEASPETPIGSPRVLVLRPAPWRRPLLAFAAGLACAVVLLGAGVAVGARFGGPLRPAADGNETVAATRPVAEAELEQLLRQYASRIERLDRENDEVREAVLDPSQRRVLYRDEFDQEIRKLGKVIDLRRATDLDLLLGEIRAAEFRAHDRIGQTQEAVRYVLLASDPRLSVE